MPSIVFADLVSEFVSDPLLVKEIETLVIQKAKESEKSLLEVPSAVYRTFTDMFETLEESVLLSSGEVEVISNNDFRTFLTQG